MLNALAAMRLITVCGGAKAKTANTKLTRLPYFLATSILAYFSACKIFVCCSRISSCFHHHRSIQVSLSAALLLLDIEPRRASYHYWAIHCPLLLIREVIVPVLGKHSVMNHSLSKFLLLIHRNSPNPIIKSVYIRSCEHSFTNHF